MTLYQSGRRSVEVGQGYLFKWPAALNPLFPGLREVGQLTAGSPSKPAQPHPRPGRRPRRRDQRLNRAVERHAVAVATAWYQQHGYTVEDVGSRKSWDLEAAKPGELRRIEVKGSRPARDAVDLTINEVTNAHRRPSTDLIVVDQIRAEVDPSRLITTSGGRVRCWKNWVPADDDSWLPVVVSHLLPRATTQSGVRTSANATMSMQCQAPNTTNGQSEHQIRSLGAAGKLTLSWKVAQVRKGRPLGRHR